MSTSIQRRLKALEGPSGHSCLSCALLRLNQPATLPTEPPPRCTHWPRRTLAEELLELNTIERMTP